MPSAPSENTMMSAPFPAAVPTISTNRATLLIFVRCAICASVPWQSGSPHIGSEPLQPQPPGRPGCGDGQHRGPSTKTVCATAAVYALCGVWWEGVGCCTTRTDAAAAEESAMARRIAPSIFAGAARAAA